MVPFLGLLSGLAFYDWKHRLIKNKVLLSAFIIIVLYRFMMNDLTWLDSFSGFFTAGGIFFIGGLLGQMGGGDIKLMALVGFTVGFSQIWLILVILCALLLLTWLLKGNQSVPFAPYILVAVLIQYGYSYHMLSL